MHTHFDAAVVRARLAELNPDLTPEILREALSRGQYALANVSALAPAPLVGMTGWGRSVQGLRELLFPAGWSKVEKPISLTMNPEGTLAIALATGTMATGNKDLLPATKWPKGAATKDAVLKNAQLELPFPGMLNDDERKKNTYATWILLFRKVWITNEGAEPSDVNQPEIDPSGEINEPVADEDLVDEAPPNGEPDESDNQAHGSARPFIMCELSLPNGYVVKKGRTGKGMIHIVQWRERLILDPIDLGGSGQVVVEPIAPQPGDAPEIHIERRQQQ